MYPPKPGICRICKKPLGTMPHFITDVPDGEHVACRDWSRRSFPFEADLRWLKKRRYVLSRTLQRVDDLGQWLTIRQKAWPRGAQETVVEGHRWVDRVRRLLRAHDDFRE